MTRRGAFSASSLVGAAAGHFILGEPLGPLHLVAVGAIVAGLALVALGRTAPVAGPSPGEKPGT